MTRRNAIITSLLAFFGELRPSKAVQNLEGTAIYRFPAPDAMQAMIFLSDSSDGGITELVVKYKDQSVTIPAKEIFEELKRGSQKNDGNEYPLAK